MSLPASTASLEAPQLPRDAWTLDSASEAFAQSLLLMPLSRDCSIHFEWSCNRWLLSTTGDAPENDTHIILLRGFLGFLPFTAEDRGARQGIIDSLRAVPHCSRGQLRFDKRGRLFFSDSVIMPDPVAPNHLLTAAVVMLLQAAPIVEAIRPHLMLSNRQYSLPA